MDPRRPSRLPSAKPTLLSIERHGWLVISQGREEAIGVTIWHCASGVVRDTVTFDWTALPA